MAQHEFEVFYDGDCPLCMREIRFMMKRDSEQRKILFTDIADPQFDAAAVGVPQQTLMARIHGRDRDGTLVEGIEVFRRLYSAIGFRISVFISRLPVISQILKLAYWVFAKNRLRLTGRRCTDQTCSV